MRFPRFIPLVLVLLASLSAPARAFVPPVRTLYFDVKNSENKEMTGWGKDFTLPANQHVTGVSAHRYNPITKKYVDESASWSGSGTENPAGTWHVTITNQTAPPVGQGVKMIFDVQFDTNSTGIVRGDYRTYAVDPVPKKGQKKGVNKGGGVPALPAGGLDSGLYYGGPSGSSVPGLGITIPPNTYAYVYQVFVRPGSPNVTYFRLPAVASRFSSFVQKSFSHNGAIDSTFISEGDTIPAAQGVFDSSSVAVFNSSGGAGVSALSWGAEGADVYARFTGLSGGQTSNVLVGMSLFPPDNVGTSDNAFLGTASTSDGDRILAPTIPTLVTVPVMAWWGKLLTALLLLLTGVYMLRSRKRATPTT